MVVEVDQTREDERAARRHDDRAVDADARRPTPVAPHTDDAVAADEHVGVTDHPVASVHGHDGAAQQHPALEGLARESRRRCRERDRHQRQRCLYAERHQRHCDCSTIAASLPWQRVASRCGRYREPWAPHRSDRCLHDSSDPLPEGSPPPGRPLLTSTGGCGYGAMRKLAGGHCGPREIVGQVFTLKAGSGCVTV